jgi:hypothetical protein
MEENNEKNSPAFNVGLFVYGPTVIKSLMRS